MSNDQHIEAGEGAHLENILQAQTAINPILAAAGAQVFVGGYEQLRYINPKTVYKRVRTDRFVGREWLLARVDEFLKRRSGYFKIEAKAGLGKTSFLAHLARTRGYIHLFAEQAPGREGVGRGLESLCAQLVTRFELGPAVLSTGAGRPDFLETLLHEAAEKNAGGDGDPIVLVVDALDEAGAPEGLNVLGLPRRLPDGVFIIVTQRPVAVRLETDQAPVVVEIDGDAPDNRRDMRRFLERVAGEPKFAERLASAGVRTDVFIETLLARCHGEWIYLYYIIDEIEGGQRTILPLEHLPHGVWQYYASYWERWRAQHEDPWPSFDLPVLSTLAAAPTELSPKALAEFAGVGQKEQAVRERLEGVWRPFVVAVPGDDRVRRYRLYHRSLRDCFEGKADPEHLTSHEKRLLEHLAEGVREAHGRISRWICQAWGGLEKGLPRLQDGSADPEMTRYGVLHLAGHLEGARSVQELHTLLALEPSKSWSARVATLVRAK